MPWLLATRMVGMSLCPDSITHCVCICVFNVFAPVRVYMQVEHLCRDSPLVTLTLLCSHSWLICIPSNTFLSLKGRETGCWPPFPPIFTVSFFPSLSHFLSSSLRMGLIWWLWFSNQSLGAWKCRLREETYRFGACHYLAIAHQQIHHQAGALLDVSWCTKWWQYLKLHCYFWVDI